MGTLLRISGTSCCSEELEGGIGSVVMDASTGRSSRVLCTVESLR